MNESHHRHQHRQVQAHHSAKWLEDRHRAEELFFISHINIFSLCAMSEPTNTCMFLKKEKWLEKRKFILICFRRITAQVWVVGVKEECCNLQAMTQPYLCVMRKIYTHLDWVLKRFKIEIAWKNMNCPKSGKWQKLWYQIATNKSMQIVQWYISR